jgi:hypothetical protein
VALLNFPTAPANNELYPSNPVVGQSQYRWEAASQTWRLLGAATSVIPGCYGDGLTVPTFCVDAQGRITSAVNVPIAVTGGTVTDITAGTGLTGGTITTSGTIALDTAYTDTLYLPLTGGTMTGDITFSGTQTFPAQDLQTVTDAGTTSTNAIDVAGLTAAGLSYPLADGTLGDYLTTDGAGNLGWIAPVTPDLQAVTDAGTTSTNAIDVAGLTAAGLAYPLTDGTANQVVATDGAGTLGWLSTLKVVTAPTASTDPGALGEVAIGTGFFYFFDGTQWLQVAGATF